MLWKRFKFAQYRNASIIGQILMQKTEISKQLEHIQFTPSEEWFHPWKKRHGLTFVELHNEAMEVNAKAAVIWTSNDMLELLKC